MDSGTKPIPNTLDDAYVILGASNPGELSDKYTQKDQEIMLAESWDYKNPELITNKVKNILESIDITLLSEDERYWRANILWFWYHHAITCAVWRYADKKQAREFTSKALSHQPEGHPNKITRMFFLLLNGDYAGARAWKNTIATEPEKSFAERLLKEFRSIKFQDETPN